jgi:hypothetical protein
MANNLSCDDGVGLGPFEDEADLMEFLAWREKNTTKHSWLDDIKREELLQILLWSEYKRHKKHDDFMEAVRIIGALSKDGGPPSPAAIAEATIFLAKSGAEALHGKLGGSRDKRDAIRKAWASGKYSSRDICAEQECASLDMSFATARKHLRKTPDPS